MNEKEFVFTLDELDEAIVEECERITEDHCDKPAGAAMLIMIGMAFSAAVRRHLIDNKNKKED